jgi:hypothetical protein
MILCKNYMRILTMLVVVSGEVQASGDSTANAVREAQGGTTVGLYTEFLGSAFCYSSLHIEAIPVRFDRGSLFESLRFSAGIGLGSIQNTYAPLLGKLVLFHGSGHLELGLGVNVLTSAGPSPTTKMLLPAMSRSDVNLSTVVGYRYEAFSGGFMFRVAATQMYDFGAQQFVRFGGFSLGWVW